MTRLETAIVSLAEVFEEYASKDDKKGKLSFEELGELFMKELSTPKFQEMVEPAEVTAAMSNLDRNKDGEVNFREFSLCIAALAKSYYRKNRGKK